METLLMTEPARKAYSYIRYSSPQQAKGRSYERQLEQTIKYCEKHGYELDTELQVIKELGRSAYKGSQQEALKKFITDCETGKVRRGSLLIVENLDRLSREAVIKAQSQFLQILGYVDIYTTQDDKLYSNQDGKIDTIDLITSLLIMARAFEESETKRKRIKDVWKARRDKIGEKKIATRYPHWLELNESGTEFAVIEKRSKIINEIFDMCIEGKGMIHIIKHLNDDPKKYPTPTTRSKGWARTTIAALLNDRRLLGELQLFKGTAENRIAEGEPVQDYFPSIISEEKFLNAQIALKSRKIGQGKVGKYDFANLFRYLLRCEKCGDTMEYVNKGKWKGIKQDYLACSNAKRGGGCDHTKHYRYAPIEQMLLVLIAENGFMPKPDQPVDLERQLEKYESHLVSTKKKLEILLEQDLSSDVILLKISELDTEVKHCNLRIQELKDKLVTIRPDYTYDELIQNLVEEKDKEIKFNNRAVLNNYFRGKAKKAIVHNDFDTLEMTFVMNDDSEHRIIIDPSYSLAGCSLGDGKYITKRLKGTPTNFVDKNDDSFMFDLIRIILDFRKEGEKYINDFSDGSFNKEFFDTQSAQVFKTIGLLNQNPSKAAFHFADLKFMGVWFEAFIKHKTKK